MVRTGRLCRWMSGLLALALFWAPGTKADPAGDPEAGQEVFSLCIGCHQIGAGAVHGIGPHLNGLFGREAASYEDFPYSKSLRRAATGGLEWHAETLDSFLENPLSMASGTRMSFPGLEDPQERRDVIAFLRIYSDDPSNIPEADPTLRATDHDVDPEILALQGDPEYGAYLSGECVSCHQQGGGDAGIPSIVYWPERDFVIAMQAYKTQKRANPVMQMIAGRLGDEEIAALAAYFARPEE